MSPTDRRAVLRNALSGLLLAAAPLLTFSAAQAQSQKVSVFYAGSLVNLMERSVGPAFTKASSIDFEGYAGGSNKLANEIKGKLRRGDIFISASPKVNSTLMGDTNGNWVTWYASFAESPLVIGYNPKSTFADALKTKRWDDVLSTPGIRIGRTDPKLDPKGLFTVNFVQHAARVYDKPDLLKETLGSEENPAQVLPEETLVGRLQSGQLDAGFFYSTETSDLNIPFVTLPAELKEKAQYTVTILNHAPNAKGAQRFVSWLLSPAGQALLKEHGIDIVAPTISGDAASVPAALRTQLAPQ
ncbi:molybdate/tungstate transport system substrate-binding protein [Robbsia andropogonis]|uniref:extracellular solute-binding protein n=1 Tax=Robbsia andropogonis TaxID=28092 RepID=UPI003D241262